MEIILIILGVYLLSRISNAIEYQKAKQEWIKEEMNRQDRLNKLYGRE